MKVKLTCYYGENAPGDVIEVDAEEGKRLIEVAGGAVAVAAAPKPAPDSDAAPAPKGKGR